MGPNIFFKTNIIGTLNLLNCFKIIMKVLNLISFKKKFKFLHVSTDEVFGSLGPKDKSFTEEVDINQEILIALAKQDQITCVDHT